MYLQRMVFDLQLCCNERLINTYMVISKLQTFTGQKQQTKAYGVLCHRDREPQG